MDLDRPSLRPSQLLVAGTHDEPVEPGVEAVRVTDGPDVEPGRGERLLDGVRRQVLPAQDQLGGSVEPAVGVGRQRRERVVVTIARAEDEIALHRRPSLSRPLWPLSTL